MSEQKSPQDQFIDELDKNFAVSANAGSGKTTAISRRLAKMALNPADVPKNKTGEKQDPNELPPIAVVTYTKKAAQEMSQRARKALMEAASKSDTANTDNVLKALNRMEHVFFGTIHSFCIMLAQRYGHEKGVNLKPEVVQEETDQDKAYWQDFLHEDPMTFDALNDAQIAAFLRHMPLESIFEFARDLPYSEAELFLDSEKKKVSGLSPKPDRRVLDESRVKGEKEKSYEGRMTFMREWANRFENSTTYLPFDKEAEKADTYGRLQRFYGATKTWVAAAGATLGAELSMRYRDWRKKHGVQTFADQIETALLILSDDRILDHVRGDDWHVILDEAQDTDPQQFEILIEITRAPGAPRKTWPGKGEPPRAGSFCMVGDGQQAIYGSRADISNFTRHINAFTGKAGEKLQFAITYRTPCNVIDWLDQGFPAAFGNNQRHNLGLPLSEDAPAPRLQVDYQPLLAGPKNIGGMVSRLPLTIPEALPESVDDWQTEEAEQIARFLKAHGPHALGVENWGDVCVLAPRNDWLLIIREVFEKHGLKVALQVRRNPNRNNPVYAWMTGLLSVVCDYNNVFEWFGVLREIFGVSDAVLVSEIRKPDRPDDIASIRNWHWQTKPNDHADPVLRAAFTALYDFINGVDNSVEDGGQTLGEFARGLASACGLAEKANKLEPGGTLNDELDRLLAEAAALGLSGTSPREWLRRLRDGLGSSRPSGKQEKTAINLLTVHSAKGLEWPVVVPAGFWRKIGKNEDKGLRLVAQTTDGERTVQAFFDSASIDDDTKESRAREQLRENTRLMYVALTRAKKHLLIPWCNREEMPEGSNLVFFGKERPKKEDPDKIVNLSFAELWNRIDLLDTLPVLPQITTEAPSDRTESPKAVALPELEIGPVFGTAPLPPLPSRLLPHQLAQKHDIVRSVLHEASADDLPYAKDDEAIEYGLWWHETMESLPWKSDDAGVAAYFEKALNVAKDRCGALGAERGPRELEIFRESEALSELRDARWSRECELPVFAPAVEVENAWIDGIMDLVIHDDANGEARVIDWKTNRRRKDESDDALLERLRKEYEPQLSAYGRCVNGFFPEAHVRMFVYSTAAGKCVEVTVK